MTRKNVMKPFASFTTQGANVAADGGRRLSDAMATDSSCTSAASELSNITSELTATKLEVTKTKVAASFAPESYAGFPGLYKLAESESTMYLVTGLSKLSIIVPSDWCVASPAVACLFVVAVWACCCRRRHSHPDTSPSHTARRV